MRAFWNSEKKAFYSRYGKQFHLPEEVIASMPRKIFLDGELWYSQTYPMLLVPYILIYDRFGRDAFEESLKISGRANPAAINWSRFKYMVFDTPTHSGTYKERYDALGIFSYPHLALRYLNSYIHLVNSLDGHSWKYLEVARKEVVKGLDHLESFLQDVLDKSGEGVILRNPASPYEPGRSSGYLKHKVFKLINTPACE